MAGWTSGRPPAVLTDEGLLLPVRPPDRLLLIGLALGALLLLAVAVGLVVLAVTGGQWSNLVGVLVVLLGAVLFAAAARGMLQADRSGSTGLLLTRLAVRLTDRPVPVSIPWDGITAVDDASPLVDQADERNPGWITFRLRVEPEAGFEDELRVLSGSVHPSIDARELTAGRELARAVCRFYLTHPEERMLLASPAALERVADLG